MSVDIEKLLREVASAPDRLEKLIREVKAVRLESARRLRWWIIMLSVLSGVFLAIGGCLVLLWGLEGTLDDLNALHGLKKGSITPKICTTIGFDVSQNHPEGFVYCSKLIPPAKQ